MNDESHTLHAFVHISGRSQQTPKRIKISRPTVRNRPNETCPLNCLDADLCLYYLALKSSAGIVELNGWMC